MLIQNHYWHYKTLKNNNSNGNNRNNYYDLVLSDIKMPEMNGIELASIIRRMNKDILIILMTASSGIADVNHSILTFLNIKMLLPNL